MPGVIISQAWRSWRTARAVALLAAAALAVGIGSTTAIYSVVNAVMLKPLPYRDGDRFVALFGAATNDPEHYSHLQASDAQAYQARTRAFDAFGWFREAGKNLTFAGQPHHIQGVRVTPALVHQLGVDPVLGQWFQDETGVVISTSLWRRLGSDPGIIGKALTLDSRSYTVTGVMPASFHLPVAGVTSAGLRTDVWMPLDPRESGGGYVAYGRRKPGITFAAAQADVKRVAAEIAAEDPVNHPAYTARVFDLRETVIKDIRPTLLLLFAAAALLFLITCANAAGLLLARSVARARETAVRVALGAGRGQLGAQYFAEGLLVSLAGAAAGVFLSVTLTPAIVTMAGDYLPRAGEIGVDWAVLLFALGAAFVASALSSLAPLWQAARTAPADALGDGARASAGARSRRVSQSLVVAEIALAFGLLAISAVLIIHLRNLSRISPGFEADDLLTFVLSVPGPVAEDPDKRIPLQRRLVEALQTIPGVGEVAFANQLPLVGCCLGTNIYPEGRPPDPGASDRMSLMAASPGYLRATRIPVRRGRALTEHDAIEDLILVVINEAAAKRYWGGQDPMDAHGRFNHPAGPRFRVIGVVGDVKNDGLGNPTVPEIYLLGSIPRVESMHFVVRSARSTASLMPDITRVVRSIDPEQPIHDVATMREIVQRTMTLERVASFMTAFFAGAAVLLAMLGVYSVVSYSVRQRTVEIGTRMALGATSRGVLSLIVSDGLKMAAYGVAIGGIAAVGAALYLGRVFKIGELGAAPFLFCTAIVAFVAFAASFLPAWRAASLSPMVAIRNQPESMWQAARLTVRRALRDLAAGGERDVVPLGTLIGEFAGALRRTASFPEALHEALATLRERTGAQSIVLLEKAAGQGYRGGGCSIPAEGIVISRLRHYPHPLALTPGDFETWVRWAREFRPEHTAEIEGLEHTGARMLVPLRAKHEIVGVVLLGPPAGRESFAPAEKELLGSSAEVFALLIENARLNERALEQEKLRRDLALAAEVQRRLLPPHPPRCGDATLAAYTLPARTVGGDYYDFLELPGERIGIAMADVAGKGIAAALLMSVVQASLRVISVDAEIPSSQLAAKMNRFLYSSTTGTNKYATFFYAQLEERGRRLRYVNAGHNAPYLMRRTQAGVETMELSAGGTVLGLFAETTYEDTCIDLCPGDLLVAYTDGVTEALNPDGEEFGEERLKDLLRETVGAPADEISSALANRMREWIAGAEQHDDLTFVVVSVRGGVA
jgi:putative ABC transport system permease protein